MENFQCEGVKRLRSLVHALRPAYLGAVLVGLGVAVGVPSQGWSAGSQAGLSARPASGTSEPGVVVDMNGLPAMSALAQQPSGEIPSRIPFTADQYRALKGQAGQRAAAPHAEPHGAQTELDGPSTQSLENTPGATKGFFPPDTEYEGSFCNGFIPSDQGVAADGKYVVQVTNSCITVLDSSTGAPFSGFPKALCTFFGRTCAHLIGDTRVIYDPQNARFLVTAADFTLNRFVVAGSATNDPTGSYFVHAIAMGNSCGGDGDFPMIGQTLHDVGDTMGVLYASWNEFCPDGSFSNDELAFRKTEVYSTKTVNIHGFTGFSYDGVPLDTMQPANVMNKGDRPRAEFLINTFDFGFGGGSCVSGCNGLVIIAYYGVVSSTPAWTGVVISTANTYFLPPNADQPGCTSGSCQLDTGGPGITGIVSYSSGQILRNDQHGRQLHRVGHPVLAGSPDAR